MVTRFVRWADSLRYSKYGRLARWDRPAGIYLPLLISLWAVALAARSWSALLLYSVLMCFGAFAARAAGCIVNDLCDARFDALVERTKSRPLASGEVSRREAFILLAIYSVVALGVLVTLPPTAIMWGLVGIPFIVLYPFCKRFTFYPQVFLGIAYCFGVLIGWFAVYDHFSYSIVTLCIAVILWTVGFDTIYAHQDRKDDMEHGIKSLAVKVGDETQEFVWSVYRIMLVFLMLTGLGSGMNIWFYFIGAFAAYYLYWQASTVDIENADDCADKFKSNVHVGVIIYIAILLGRL